LNRSLKNISKTENSTFGRERIRKSAERGSCEIKAVKKRGGRKKKGRDQENTDRFDRCGQSARPAPGCRGRGGQAEKKRKLTQQEIKNMRKTQAKHQMLYPEERKCVVGKTEGTHSHTICSAEKRWRKNSFQNPGESKRKPAP